MVQESAPGGGAAAIGDDVKNCKIAEMHSLNFGGNGYPGIEEVSAVLDRSVHVAARW